MRNYFHLWGTNAIEWGLSYVCSSTQFQLNYISIFFWFIFSAFRSKIDFSKPNLSRGCLIRGHFWWIIFFLSENNANNSHSTIFAIPWNDLMKHLRLVLTVDDAINWRLSNDYDYYLIPKCNWNIIVCAGVCVCVCVYNVLNHCIPIMLIMSMGDLSIYSHLKCVILIKTNDKYNPSDENVKEKEEIETATNIHTKRLHAQSQHKAPENNIIITSKEILMAHAKYRTLNTKILNSSFSLCVCCVLCMVYRFGKLRVFDAKMISYWRNTGFFFGTIVVNHIRGLYV